MLTRLRRGLRRRVARQGPITLVGSHYVAARQATGRKPQAREYRRSFRSPGWRWAWPCRHSTDSHCGGAAVWGSPSPTRVRGKDRSPRWCRSVLAVHPSRYWKTESAPFDALPRTCMTLPSKSRTYIPRAIAILVMLCASNASDITGRDQIRPGHETQGIPGFWTVPEHPGFLTAERVGFEPTDGGEPVTSLAGRPVQPDSGTSPRRPASIKTHDASARTIPEPHGSSVRDTNASNAAAASRVSGPGQPPRATPSRVATGWTPLVDDVMKTSEAARSSGNVMSSRR